MTIITNIIKVFSMLYSSYSRVNYYYFIFYHIWMRTSVFSCVQQNVTHRRSLGHTTHAIYPSRKWEGCRLPGGTRNATIRQATARRCHGELFAPERHDRPIRKCGACTHERMPSWRHRLSCHTRVRGASATRAQLATLGVFRVCAMPKVCGGTDIMDIDLLWLTHRSWRQSVCVCECRMCVWYCR